MPWQSNVAVQLLPEPLQAAALARSGGGGGGGSSAAAFSLGTASYGQGTSNSNSYGAAATAVMTTGSPGLRPSRNSDALPTRASAPAAGARSAGGSASAGLGPDPFQCLDWAGRLYASSPEPAARLKLSLAARMAAVTRGPMGPLSMAASDVGKVLKGEHPAEWASFASPKLRELVRGDPCWQLSPSVGDMTLRLVVPKLEERAQGLPPAPASTMGPLKQVLQQELEAARAAEQATSVVAAAAAAAAAINPVPDTGRGPAAAAAAAAAALHGAAPGGADADGAAGTAAAPVAAAGPLAEAAARVYGGSGDSQLIKHASAVLLAGMTRGPMGPHSMLSLHMGAALMKRVPQAWSKVIGNRFRKVFSPSDGVFTVEPWGSHVVLRMDPAALLAQAGMPVPPAAAAAAAAAADGATAAAGPAGELPAGGGSAAGGSPAAAVAAPEQPEKQGIRGGRASVAASGRDGGAATAVAQNAGPGAGAGAGPEPGGTPPAQGKLNTAASVAAVAACLSVLGTSDLPLLSAALVVLTQHPRHGKLVHGCPTADLAFALDKMAAMASVVHRFTSYANKDSSANGTTSSAASNGGSKSHGADASGGVGPLPSRPPTRQALQERLQASPLFFVEEGRVGLRVAAMCQAAAGAAAAWKDAQGAAGANGLGKASSEGDSVPGVAQNNQQQQQQQQAHLHTVQAGPLAGLKAKWPPVSKETPLPVKLMYGSWHLFQVLTLFGLGKSGPAPGRMDACMRMICALACSPRLEHSTGEGGGSPGQGADGTEAAANGSGHGAPVWAFQGSAQHGKRGLSGGVEDDNSEGRAGSDGYLRSSSAQEELLGSWPDIVWPPPEQMPEHGRFFVPSAAELVRASTAASEPLDEGRMLQLMDGDLMALLTGGAEEL